MNAWGHGCISSLIKEIYARQPLSLLSCPDSGVQDVPDDPDVFVLYAHKTCHSERKCVDPDATWRMVCEALHALHTNRDDFDIRGRAIELLEILSRWLRMGGFPPTNVSG
jgi:hypothetical protein